MAPKSRTIITVVLAGIWVNASEFFRNQVLLPQYWVKHYESLGMSFPSEPQNGIMWIVWGLLLAIAIYWISRRFTLMQTALISWLMAFLMMWLVVGNLRVLPGGILLYAVPLSLLEVFIGSYICVKMSPGEYLLNEKSGKAR